jgi:lauroyl/myristoyl acyltransferase
VEAGLSDDAGAKGAISSPAPSGPVAGAMLVRRAVQRATRLAMTWEEGAVAVWLCLGVAVAPLPYAYRWSLCKALARPACRTRRAKAARLNAVRGGNLSEADAARVIHELYAGRLAAKLDVVRGLLMGPDVRIGCKGLDHIDAALARGRGVMLWISDFVGAGDVVKLALAKAGYRLTHLSRAEHGFTTSAVGVRFLNPFRIKYENRYLEDRVVFDRMNPAPAMSRLIGCLRLNRIVSIMAGAHEGGTLADVPFLAGRLQISIGAPRLARLCGAPLITVSVLRDPVRHEAFEVVFEAPVTVPKEGREKEALLKVACDYRDRLESGVRANPGSWVGWRRSSFRSAEK